MADTYPDFYQKLRTRLRRWAETEEGKANRWTEYLLLAPDLFHLMCKLSLDRTVPAKEKAKLVAAIGYFLSPVDLLPEIPFGPLGYADDVVLAACVLGSLINRTSKETVARHWAGERDVLEVIQHILAVADEMVGAGLWNKIRRIALGKTG